MITLYHNSLSTCSQKARLCLAEKDLEWHSHELNLQNGDQRQDWYARLNPREVVPTLVDDGKVIPESNVIIEYLDEQYPEPRLSPADPYGRARMRLWTKQLDEGIHDLASAVLSFAIAFRDPLLARPDRGKASIDQIPDPIKRERRREVVEKGLESEMVVSAVMRLESILRDMQATLSESDWLAGSSYSLADLAYTPYLNRLDDLNLLGFLADKPHVADWYERCRRRPSYDEAITKWANSSAIAAMKNAGEKHWPKIKQIIATLR